MSNKPNIYHVICFTTNAKSFEPISILQKYTSRNAAVGVSRCFILYIRVNCNIHSVSKIEFLFMHS